MDTLHELRIAIDDPVTLQDHFSQLAQHAGFNRAKPEPVDQQSRRLPNDFVLEEELCWLDGVVGKVRFQLEEGIEPCAVAGKDECAVAEDSEGGFVLCRHGFEFPVLIRGAPEGEGHRHEP